MEKYDVVIVGAGLSGIGAAYHLQDKCPGKSYAVLEARESMGGTWDLFKYPGVRSDSDMYTLGFSFYPWRDPKAIADGPAILSYIKETAAHFGIDDHIKYKHKVVHASWSSPKKCWTLDVRVGEEYREMECNFLFMCSGYYSYEEGHRPQFPEEAVFEGPIIHPQKWDKDLDYRDKEVVIIGSGATAVTLLPELAQKASRVTMLQRTPTFIMNLPSEDGFANTAKKLLPAQWAHGLARWKNILLSMLMYQLSKKWPDYIRKSLQKAAQKELKEKYKQEDFDPPYDPWDQRLCLVPDNNLFEAIKGGNAHITTDQIEKFIPEGIQLASGKRLKADIVVAATGLKLQLFGGMSLDKDGEALNINDEYAYRGVMVSNFPNFAVAVGYTNASWTLKCDLNCVYVTRVINQMDKAGKQMVVPRIGAHDRAEEDLIDLSAGYIQRGKHLLPKQGKEQPWKIHQNYLKDLRLIKRGSVDDGCLEYL
ncbi:MAG: NAD(P)/FAD-dependent oxidoreductase [Bacteroidia bacterium]|nr:NAD(P)/FAD-dependent oxidoreductase [Bacteroidia bacterium]